MLSFSVLSTVFYGQCPLYSSRFRSLLLFWRCKPFIKGHIQWLKPRAGSKYNAKLHCRPSQSLIWKERTRVLIGRKPLYTRSLSFPYWKEYCVKGTWSCASLRLPVSKQKNRASDVKFRQRNPREEHHLIPHPPGSEMFIDSHSIDIWKVRMSSSYPKMASNSSEPTSFLSFYWWVAISH